VVDERPWRFTFTADNTGAPQTGRTLMSFIYQNANVASRDHVLSLQYSTTAEEPKNVNVYGFGYHIPLYALGDSLDVYANYSDVDSGTVLAGNFALQITGRGKIAGARYNHAFARAGEFQSAATLGIDHKAYENSAVLLGFDLGNAITVHPLSLSYWGLWKGAQSDLSFNLTGVHNIPGGNKGSDREFEAARANARTDYNLARYSLTYTHQLPMQWHALALVQGQYTRDKLIAGEQFGAGGVTSVRGFESREIAADNGYSGTLELHTPELCARWNNASCRALVFLDGARLRRNAPFPANSGRLPSRAPA
jgi:Hemolysin activation/secretion protein